jgi:hypothetical protein
MVKRHTIALLAAEEQVPLKLTARQQALVDAVANRMLPAERNPVSPVDKPRAKARAGSRAEAADRTGRTRGDSDATGRVVSQSGHLSG